LEIAPPTSEPRTADEMSEWDRAIPEGREVLRIEAVPSGGSRVLLFLQLRGLGRTMSGTASLLELDVSTGEWAAHHPFAWRVTPVASAAGKVVCYALDSRPEDGSLAHSLWLLDTENWTSVPLIEKSRNEDGDVDFMLMSLVAISRDGKSGTAFVYRDHPDTHRTQNFALVFDSFDAGPTVVELRRTPRHSALLPDATGMLYVIDELMQPIDSDRMVGIDPFVDTLDARVLLKRSMFKEQQTDTITALSLDRREIWGMALSPDGQLLGLLNYRSEDEGGAIIFVSMQTGEATISELNGFERRYPTPPLVWSPSSDALLCGFTRSGSGTQQFTDVAAFAASGEELGRWRFPGKTLSSKFWLPGEEHPYAVVDNEDIVQLLPDGAFRPVWSLRLLDK
ncbi:MAG: hypothetical protein EA423_09290, partial [Phycisphaerales bacterium]